MKKELLFAFSLLLLLSSLPAVGQEPASPSPSTSPPSTSPPSTSPPPAELTPLLRDALSKVRAGDAASAVVALEAARETGGITDPEKALLGALYVETGRPEEALQTLAPLADGENVDPVVLYNAGRAALEAGLEPQAEGYLERAIEGETATPAIRLLGLIRMAQGRIEEAFGLLVAWSSMDMSDIEARTAAAFCGMQLGYTEQAAALLDGLPGDDPRVGYLRGRVLALSGEHDGAISLLQPFVDFILQPPDEAEAQRLAADSGLVTDILSEYGRAMLAESRGAEAVDALKKATELRPEIKDPWQLLGQALVAAGRTREAQEALARYQALAEAEMTVPPEGGE